jgi:hypothetical protein
MQGALPACRVGTLPAQGFRGFPYLEKMEASQTRESLQMLDPKSLVAALRPTAGCFSHMRLAELLRMFAKDSVGVRVAVLLGLLFAELVQTLLMASMRLTVVLAIIFCASTTGLT